MLAIDAIALVEAASHERGVWDGSTWSRIRGHRAKWS